MRIVPLPSAAAPQLSPDLVWDGIMGDLAPAGPDEPSNRGGLRSIAALETAVLICLMTDARADDGELRDGDVNRGWAGDSFDLGENEAPIGSRLWLLARRSVSEPGLPALAEGYAIDACRTLVAQGAAARVTAVAGVSTSGNGLDLTVTLTDRYGSVLAAPRYALLWRELNGIRVQPS